jgi:hypothetical protein
LRSPAATPPIVLLAPKTRTPELALSSLTAALVPVVFSRPM